MKITIMAIAVVGALTSSATTANSQIIQSSTSIQNTGSQDPRLPISGQAQREATIDKPNRLVAQMSVDLAQDSARDSNPQPLPLAPTPLQEPIGEAMIAPQLPQLQFLKSPKSERLAP